MKLPHNRGFSLVELMVGVAILGILLGLAGPGFAQWLRDTKIRNQAESVMYGLQQARGEAIKRNAVVRFQLVTPAAGSNTVDSTCALTLRSNFWVVSHGDPSGQCNLAESLQSPPPTVANDAYSTGFLPPPAAAGTAAGPILLVRGLRAVANDSAQTNLSIVAGVAGTPDPIVCFDGNGRVQRFRIDSGRCTGSSNPGTTATATRIDITVSNPAAGSCAGTPGGTQRCLTVQVSPSGEARMCDPAVNAATDPRLCS